ncbi:MAG: phospholipid carrier-dependent glycosyltransferase [Patescibacteria group bacterium]
MRSWRTLVLAAIPLIFFLTGLFTLGDYGLNWDESNHFTRGQAYLHYYLTGKKTYDDLPGWAELAAANATVAKADPIYKQYRYSRFMVPSAPAEVFFAQDAGHPPLNGILAAAFNRIFYGKLGWLPDVESHHLFILLVSTGLVALVTWWAYRVMGFWPAVVSGLAIALHPMFLGESRFNIKDPVEATFFTLTLYLLWSAIMVRKPQEEPKRLILAGVAFGLALATKFNALFILPIFGLWHALELAIDPDWRKAVMRALTWRVALGYVGFVAIGFGMVYIFWPYLWGNAFEHLGKVLAFYTHLGTGQHYNAEYLLPGGFNYYPLLDVIYRTPLVTLALVVIGIVSTVAWFIRKGFAQKKVRDGTLATYVLWLLMLTLPIARVVAPGSSLYGATRQIMEHIPALALLAGVGTKIILDVLSHYRIKQFLYIFIILLATSYLLLATNFVRLHPNENLMLNSLIGGLRGAYAKNYPSWANTVGNAYQQGIEWLNANAEPNSKLTLIYGLGSALPPGRLHLSIDFSSRFYSGSLQEGEYVMEMWPLPDGYLAEYPQAFLEPVYTYQVDGVPILKIWKNDKEHQKGNWRVDPTPIVVEDRFVVGPDLLIDLKKEYPLDRLVLEYEPTPGCEKLKEFALHIAGEDGKYVRKENIPYVHINRPQLAEKPFPDYFFAGQPTRYIKISSITKDQENCLFNPTSIKIWQFR